ncbi:hypothetical protein TNCV_3803711 [Trichonephila clavipes]|nr:hypothetical protein TNCV_3803711 [Trichonephila clavipes]
MKRRTLLPNMAAISRSLLVACHADSLFQIFPDPWENTFGRNRENDARRKIWETLLPSPVPMGLPRQEVPLLFLELRLSSLSKT